MERRDFLIRGGLALGAGGLALGTAAVIIRPALSEEPRNPQDWAWVRAQFDLLDPGLAYFAGFYLVSHPKSVRAALDKHRAGLDRNPFAYQLENGSVLEDALRTAAGEYLGVDGVIELALTDSTTQGLATLYAGLKLRDDQEILTSTHDHPFATHQALALRERRMGTMWRMVPLYANSAKTSVDEIVGSVVKAITPRTRVLALTWVHSNTGVKLPVRAVADAVAQLNRTRDEKDGVILCLDGVHGLGIDDVTLPQLGCDFFSAGTHKWMFAPRGTGILWGKAPMWNEVLPTIPVLGFTNRPATAFSPGGFHSFEHRWAAVEGFKLHQAIGKARVQARLRELNGQLRLGLSRMRHVDLLTPLSEDLSAGITCFNVEGKTPRQVIDYLGQRKIAGSESHYTPPCARLACSLWNTPDEVANVLRVVGEMSA